MSLTIGARFGPYEIEAPLGAGGMGEVYRARDMRLGRSVAIKVLPATFTLDPNRLARFEREARVLASLNHPNIATIYSVEEIEGGVRALVLELVDGDTLADRILIGFDLRQTLDVVRQIAQALDAAHEKGIVHRDLKPGNVMITPAGVVKVLDFGLAKHADSSTPDLTTVSMHETREGALLGTAPYMSPEQARGQPVDRRTDIWAFGCLLFEMLTRDKAFSGPTSTDTIAAIIERDPNWAVLPPATPASVKKLLQRCLTKDVRRRMRDAGDIALDLETALGELDRRAAPGIEVRPRRWRMAALAGAVIAVVAIAAFLARRAPVGRTNGSLTGAMTRVTFDAGLTTEPSISADGRFVAYASNRSGDGNLDVYVQQLGGGPSIRVTNNPADDREPSVSPDGTLIAFRSDRNPRGVYIVAALGGGARLLAPDGLAPRVSPDGKSVAYWTGGWLAPRSVGSARRVFVVPSAGGAPAQLGEDLASAGDVTWSPDGRGLLAYARRATTGSDSAPDWWWIPVDGGPSIATGAFGNFKANGLELDDPDIQPVPNSWTTDGVVFTAQRTGSDARGLWRIRVDPESHRAVGDPVPLTNDTTNDVFPSVAQNGRMVFAAQSSVLLLFGMPLDANAGKQLGSLRNLREDEVPSQRSSMSEDGRLLVFPKYEFESGSLWVRDLRTRQERQLAATPRTPLNPVMSADGRWVAYTVTETESGGGGGPGSGYIVESMGGVAKKVCDSCSIHAWTRDNQQLVITDAGGTGLIRVDARTGVRTPLVTTKRAIDRPMFGPNAAWVTFNSGNGVQLAAVHPDRAAGEDEWTTILETSGGAERTAGMSPDGGLLYVLLERDGFRCLYAMKIDASTGRRVAEPFPVAHLHDAALRWGSTGRGSAVAANLFVANLNETRSNIWMTTLASPR